MRSTFYRPRTLTIMLGMMFLLIFCTVTFAQTEPAGYIPLRLASGTFDPLQTAPETLSIPSALRNSSSSAYYIVQFTGPITDMDKAELTAAGADILTYIPDYAFIVRANAPVIDALANLENFRWAGAYLPYFRLSPELRTRYVETSAPTEMLELVLLLPPDVDETAVTQAINEWGGSVTAHASTHWKITLRISVSSDYLIDLATLPDVQWIEPYYSPQLYNSRAVEITNAETIWDTHGLYGEGQIVAVADSGFDQG
ncbi:MAG: hypothetical protein KC413_17525, partial [Anaerolineales bacterium]|nr:hypothetical protein [Anaerolineales bacterium]